jgi:hypothetical protein
MNNFDRLIMLKGYDNAVKEMDEIFMNEFYMAKKERRYPKYNREEMSEYLKFTSNVRNEEEYNDYKEKCNQNLLKFIKENSV